MKCVNIKLPGIKELVDTFGEIQTSKILDKFPDKIPSIEEAQEIYNKLPKGVSVIEGFKDFAQGKQFQKLTTEEIAKEQNNSLFGLNTQNQEQLEFHINTLNVVSKFLENVGIKQRLIPEFLSQDGNVVEGAIAAANFIDGTVDIIDDLEKGRTEAWNKLPEEAAHWWYRLLDTNSPLKKALWESHQTALKNDELYAGQYGKLVKSPSDLTEESIGQLIAEAIKRIETKNGSAADYSFFKKFLEWINSIIDIFKGTTQDQFEVAAMKILSSDMSDLMTWEEYRKLNNIVNFADILTEQSVAPIDYTLIEDIGFIGSTFMEDAEGNAKSGYRFHFRDSDWIKKYGDSSPSFYTQEELDNWVSANVKEYDQRQKQILQEVRDNQIFFDRLLNKTFRKKSKFLPKTLRKYFDIIDAQNLNQLREWNISQELQQITKKLSEQEKKQIIETNGYTNIAPTLKVLPDLLQKYGRKTTPEIIKQEIEITNKLVKKEITKEQATELRQKLESKKKGNPIVLSEPIKIDGAKKQELSILNGIKEMIKLENPNLKSITAEEFVAEAHNWLETNYLLGFANENSYLSYRTDQTFSYLSDRQSNEDVDITNLTEEEIQRLPFEERQRIANIVGLTKQNPDVYHNKVSLRFNDMYHLKSGHFDKSPSAWGNLTYFYTGKNKWKDAVLLHEIQNDNIEFLREFKAEKVDLETSLGRYLQQLNADLLDNITQIESGGKKIIKNNVWSTNPLNYQLEQLKNLPLEQGLSQLKQSLNERIELYKSDSSKNPEKAQEAVEKAYSQRRIFQNFKKRGGIKSLLTKQELEDLKNILHQLNTEEVETATWSADDNAYFPDLGIRDLKQKKKDFSNEVIAIQTKINNKLSDTYGDNAPLINLTAPAKPRTKNQIRQGVQRSQELNENVNWLLAYSEKKILDKLSKNIEESKRNYIQARNATVANNFNVQLSKITLEQYNTLIENFKYNQDLLNRLIDEQAKKDIQKESNIQDKITEAYQSIENRDYYYEYFLDGKRFEVDTREEAEEDIEDYYNPEVKKRKQKKEFETLKQQALDKKAELEKNYGKIEEEVKQTLEIEMNYFTPLVHHLIQKHINQYGKDFPMYFSGYNITKLTQGNDRTAMIYAGKDEIDLIPHSDININGKNYRHDGNMKYVPLAFYIDNKQYRKIKGEFSTREDGLVENITEQEYNKAKQEYEKAYQQATERRAKEIKFEAAKQIGFLSNEHNGTNLSDLTDKELDEGIKELNQYKKQSKQNMDRVINTMMNISNNKPIETGAIYNAMSQISGIKLIWQDKIEGLQGNVGGYLVDLTNYNYNTPILYGLNTSKVVPINPNMVNNSEIQYSKKQGYNPKTITDEYGNTWNEIEIKKEKDTQTILFQKEGTETIKANKKTLEKVKEFLRRNNIKIESLPKDLQNINGAANFLEQLVQIAEGKEDVALPEEAMHFALEMIKIANPKLYQELNKAILKLPIFNQVKELYKEDPSYRNSDGSLNIQKIKDEAITKQLTNDYVEKTNSTFFKKIINWIKSLLNNTFNPFEEAVKQFDNLTQQVNSTETYYQLNNTPLQEVQNKINVTNQTLKKAYKLEDDDAILQTEEEANNWYERLIDGKWQKIQHRVTDRVKTYYNQIFKNKIFTAEEKAINEIKRDLGIHVHNVIESIINRFVDKTTHKLKQQFDPKPSISEIPGDTNFEAYDKLEQYVLNLINQFDKESLIYTEQMVFNPKYKSNDKTLADGEAGTIDLLVIEPTDKGPKAHIFDWKSMGNVTSEVDVKSYKQGAYSIQLGTYKTILKNEYGIDLFGQIRAVPIMLDIDFNKKRIKGMNIGIADPTKVKEFASIKEAERLKLLQVPLESERTGVKALDKILDKLSKAYNKLKKEKVSEDDKLEKKERLATLKTALRIIQTTHQISPLVDAMEIYSEQLKTLNERYKDLKENINQLSKEERESLSEDFLDLDELKDFYQNIAVDLEGHLDKEHKLFKTISELEFEIGISLKHFQQNKKDFINKIAEDNNIFGILNAEKVMRGVKKMFKSFDEYSNKAAQLIVSLFNKAEAEAVEKSTAFNKELLTVIKKIQEQQLDFSKISTKNNTLIKEISDDFKNAFENAKNKEQFIKDNIQNIEQYIEEINRLKNEKIEKVKNRTPLYKGEFEDQSKQEKIDEINQNYDPFSPKYVSQILLKHIKKEKWYTPEFKQILNTPLYDLYAKIQELNTIAYESGYISYREIQSFLPFVPKSAMEKMANNGWNVLNAPIDFLHSLNTSTQRGTDFSQITGAPISYLPKPFTENIAKKIDKDGNITFDYSIISQEIGKSVIAYSQAMFKYQAMSQIDEQIELILQVEKTKESIATDAFNKAILEDVEGELQPKVIQGNEENAKTLYNFVQYLIYNNRYPLSQDINLGLNPAINKVKKGLNKVFGTKFTESTAPTSMIKTIDALNRGMTIKTLAGNPISGAVNWFGAFIQASAQKNDYFSFTEFTKAQSKIGRMLQMTEKEGDKFAGFINMFNPFTDNQNYEMLKQASSSKLGKINLGDMFMVFMHKTEMQSQMAVFDSLLNNFMIQDDKLVHIQKFVKDKYTDRWAKELSQQERKEISLKIEQEIQELKDKKSLQKVSEFKNGKLLFEGKEFTNKEEIQKLSILSKKIYKSITGNVSNTSINQAKLDIFTSSMMVFKNWIPKLWFTRFGGLESRTDPFNRDAYEVGRVKVFYNTLFLKINDKVGAISDILKMTDRGVDALDALYEQYAKEYKLNEGQEFTMSKQDFNDMIVQNLRNQIRELVLLLALMAASFALGFAVPDDEDKRAKAGINMIRKVTDQFVQELSFFYNPVNFEEMLSRGAFPSVGLITQIGKFIGQSSMEITGFNPTKPILTSDEVREKAHPIKYGLKLVPVASAWLQYLTFISPEIAKELDVHDVQH